MKATLTFDLPAETQEHECAVHGGEYKAVLWEVDQWIRRNIKYGHTYKDPTEALAAVRNELWELVNERNLRLE